MARRRRSRGEPPPPEPDAPPAPPEAVTEPVEVSPEPVEVTPEPVEVSPEPEVNEAPEAEADVSPEPATLAFDPAASQRILRACAGIHSFASSASDEASQAAAPFLTFSQRSRIRALATDFESRRQTFSVQAAPASAQPSAQVDEGSALGREEIEAIVSHRIDIAVQEALQKLGISPDATIPRQVERTVEIQLNTQEQRLLDYVKRHLTDSLEMLESTIEDRIADYIDAAELGDSDRETEEARAEIDAKVEEAREQLLKNIDEVREVQVGFDINNFASQITEINDTATGGHGAIGDGDIVAAANGDEIELGGDEDEIELGGDEDEIELGGDEDEIELNGDEGPPTELELAPEVELAPEIEIAPDDEGESAEFVVSGDEDEIDLSVESLAEVELLPDGDESADVTQSGEPATLELESDAPTEDEEDAAALGDIDLSDEAVEEISIIAPMPDEEVVEAEIELDTAELVEFRDDDAQLEAGMALDLGEDDEEEDEETENLALTTLGTGPDDLQVAPIEDISDRDVEIEIDEDEEPESEEARATTIERYLQRAAEMRNRRQAAAAMELYSKVLDLDDANYEARIGRGVLNLEGKDYKRAVDEFTRAEKIDASRPASALGLAEVHFHRKQFNKAIRHYTQCLKLDDKLAQAYCNRGLSYYYQKNYKKAFLDLMRAYDIDSELPNIKKYLKLVRNKVKSEKD